jgi:hypothetical protein
MFGGTWPPSFSLWRIPQSHKTDHETHRSADQFSPSALMSSSWFSPFPDLGAWGVPD